MHTLSTTVHLPNGNNLTVLPVFGGFFFKANELNVSNSVFPAGWTVTLHTEYVQDEDVADQAETTASSENSSAQKTRKHIIHSFKTPTLQNDRLFISSISNPSSNDFKAPTSPTRQIAMMLWATLYWYFHQLEPSQHLETEASKNTPISGRPKGEWRVYVTKEGVLRGRNLIQKLERMGLITTEDSTVGLNPDDKIEEGWSDMFVSRRMFWQLSARLFLFTLSPTGSGPGLSSPYASRPSSPVRSDHPGGSSPNHRDSMEVQLSPGLWSPSPPGPFASGSHLPTYYPPPPLQYVYTSGVKHPLRPKPPRQGEIFYTRFIPSIGQYLAFRVATLSDRPVAYKGPTTAHSQFKHHHTTSSLSSLPPHLSSTTLSEPGSGTRTPAVDSGVEDTIHMTDLQLLHKWMNMPRVAAFWGCAGPISTQEEFLKTNLSSKHSFPVIGLWDGKPFGYFEIYWVKEDILGRHLGDRAGEFDRGIHCLVGEDEFRGSHRVKCWLTSLAHYAFDVDYRTNAVVLEPRVDNTKFISHLNSAGFLKEGEVTFPHKQSAFVKLRRESFEAPAL
ncbi:siderophore biosynthesis protein-like protein [Xylogone sp. PMI_703]|nr:siderophore biosynthesis protein-like protein [Xylogone sp. PMI_703]